MTTYIVIQLLFVGDSTVSGIANNTNSFANNQNNNESVIQPNNNQISAAAAAMDTDEDELLTKLLDDYSIFNSSSNSSSPTVQLGETSGQLSAANNGRIVATNSGTNNGSINAAPTSIAMSCMAQNETALSSTMQGMESFVSEGGLPVFH